MLFKVWHARVKQDEHGRVVGIRGAFGFEPTSFPEDFQHVADVRATEMGEVFQLTNHIFEPWYENVNVVVPEELDKRLLRSTSVGDVVTCGEEKWAIAPIGFIKLASGAVPALHGIKTS